ncbi:MAG: tRNA epoxyqueuosine(34) reductase QueG [Alphaproteobacteria bacterium]|nr:tRNA epoxyqueuosine(34) reductase QueG [Alphaproteobacteria bacterium]
MPNSISDAVCADARETVRAVASAQGFDIVRFARVDAPAGARENLASYLAEGRHGTMAWMARNAERRADPRVLWPDAKSLILLGVNYGPDCDPLEILTQRELGAISVYARGDDYHDVLKARLKAVAGFVADTFNADVKVFVDTAPVLEKPLAQAAGLGWQGKHTNLVSREFGSWLFLGSIFTTAEFEPDEAQSDHCGQCRACLDVCPTKAFPAPYQLDARRCISYLTIEHKDHIPLEFRIPIGNRIYGCDDCLAVCPWNKFAQVARQTRFRARAELRRPRLAELAALDESGFRALFRGSPIKRIGRDRFVRNVLIAIGNSGEIALAETAKTLLRDGAAIVRAMAVWALARLLCDDDFAALKRIYAPLEINPEVRAEWEFSSTARPSG